MAVNWKRLTRKLHYWCSIIIVAPMFVILFSGMLLQVKKQVAWVQPTTHEGKGSVPEVTFAEILEIAKSVPEARITDWGDISRLDVRPNGGIVKIRAKSNWEIQIDHQTGEILQTAYRRSDTIESIHDGSFFYAKAKPWLFLSVAIGLLLLCITGIYMFLIPYLAKPRRRADRTPRASATTPRTTW